MGIDHKLDRIADKVGDLAGIVKEVKDDNKNTRITIITVVVAAVFAGLAALLATQSNLLTAFSTGLTAAQTKTEAQKPGKP